MQRYVWPIVVLILGVFIAGGAVQSLRDWAGYQRQSYYSEYVARDLLPPCGSAEPHTAQPQKEPCGSATDYAYLDTFIQMDMAKAAQQQVFITGLELGLIAASIFVAAFALRQSRDISRRELRAYVGVRAIQAKRKVGSGSFGISCMFTNKGKTPARDVQAWLSVGVREPEFGEATRPPGSFASSSSILPEGALRIVVDTTDESEEALELKRERGWRIWAFGRVEYRDIYGRPWHTEFLRSGEIGEDIRLTVEPTGNDST